MKTLWKQREGRFIVYSLFLTVGKKKNLNHYRTANTDQTHNFPHLPNISYSGNGQLCNKCSGGNKVIRFGEFLKNIILECYGR